MTASNVCQSEVVPRKASLFVLWMKGCFCLTGFSMADDRLLAFRQTLFDLHKAGSYKAALELLAEQGSHFPERQDDIFFWKACFFALDEQMDKAILSLEQGLEDGYWWKPEFLSTEEDLNKLHGQPAFERLLEDCQNRFKAAKTKSQSKLHSFLPPMSAPIPYPAIVAMHGRDMDPKVTTGYWKLATELGCFVAVPQSSQISGINRFVWDEEKRALNEIEGHLEDILGESAIAADKVILGGFSQGAHRAIKFALQGLGAAHGFIAVAPYITDNDIAQFESIFAELVNRELRGYIITGEHDPQREHAARLTAKLQEAGIACTMEEYPDLGHEYPPNFEISLQKALDFILN